MVIKVKENFVHWNYFIALEQDLIKVSRFIEFLQENFNTYSIELAHLLLATSSEIDVVLKALCNMKKSEKDHKNINHYKETIGTELPDLINEKTFIPRYGLELQPWTKWNNKDNPLWWGSYNNVKHNRDEHFKEANLKNTLNSVAALSLVVLYYYREIFSEESAHTFKQVTKKLQPKPSLVEFQDGYTYGHLLIS